MRHIVQKETTASLDVDATNCFTPTCPDEIPVPGGDEISEPLNRQSEYAAYRTGSKDAHSEKAIYNASPSHPQLSQLGAPDADVYWNKHSIPGTIGFEMIPGLPQPRDYDYFVWKGIEPDMHPYGACYHDLAERLSTGLIEFLKVKKVTTVIVGGLATDYCVKTTALQLAKAGFRVIVNLEACRGVHPDTVRNAISEMTNAQVIVIQNLDEIQVETTL